METTEIISTDLVLKNDPTFKIGITAEFEEDFEDSYFHHILTNQKCERLEQCFYNWSEQDEEENEKWAKLRELIDENSENLMQWIYDSEGKTILFSDEGIEYE